LSDRVASAGEADPEALPATPTDITHIDTRQAEIDAHVAASDAFISKHGSLADEFGTL
jgi:hypothetical protein